MEGKNATFALEFKRSNVEFLSQYKEMRSLSLLEIEIESKSDFLLFSYNSY